MSSRLQEIELKRIKPNRLNPRLEFRKEALDELADSIEQTGLIEPIIVRPSDQGYEVVVGERRYRASQQAKIETVPAIVRDLTDDEVIELNLIENIQREDLSAIEKGNSCKRLIDKFPKKYPNRASLARRLGVSDKSIGDWLTLVTAMAVEAQRYVAPETTTRSVPAGKVDYRTAAQVAHKIKEKPKQVELIKTLVDQKVKGRNAREVVKKVSEQPKTPIRKIVKEVVEAPLNLPFRLDHSNMILRRIKTQTSRHMRSDEISKLKVGSIIHGSMYEPHFVDLVVKEIKKKKLSQFTEEDAKREGGYTLEEFKKVWKSIHGEWNPNDEVDVILFDMRKKYIQSIGR